MEGAGVERANSRGFLKVPKKPGSRTVKLIDGPRLKPLEQDMQ